MELEVEAVEDEEAGGAEDVEDDVDGAGEGRGCEVGVKVEGVELRGGEVRETAPPSEFFRRWPPEVRRGHG